MTAAGIVLSDPSGAILFLKRTGVGDHKGDWSIPGGRIEKGETPYDAACRELIEETGYIPHGDISQIYDTETFTTFGMKVPEQFEPDLNDEHDDWVWLRPEEAPYPLHSGLRQLLDGLNRLSWGPGDLVFLDPETGKPIETV